MKKLEKNKEALKGKFKKDVEDLDKHIKELQDKKAARLKEESDMEGRVNKDIKRAKDKAAQLAAEN